MPFFYRKKRKKTNEKRHHPTEKKPVPVTHIHTLFVTLVYRAVPCSGASRSPNPIWCVRQCRLPTPATPSSRPLLIRQTKFFFYSRGHVVGSSRNPRQKILKQPFGNPVSGNQLLPTDLLRYGNSYNSSPPPPPVGASDASVPSRSPPH